MTQEHAKLPTILATALANGNGSIEMSPTDILDLMTEHDNLRRQIQEAEERSHSLMMTVAAIIDAQGGTVRIPMCSLLSIPHKAKLIKSFDPITAEYKIRLNKGA